MREKPFLATYTPKRTDDLRPQFLPLIGETVEWRFGFVQDSEGNPYEGQRCYYTDDARFDGYWTPECDLTRIVGE